MLEQPGLLLRPWIHSIDLAWPKTMVQGAAWARTIVSPASGQALGFAAWDTFGVQGFLGWLGRKKIQVFETEDESLLMTVYRPWGLQRSWNIVDAEGHRVGKLCRDVLYDGLGGRFATICAAGEGSDWAWRGEDGAVLATWQDSAGQGRYVRFGEAEVNPFLRMAALAGILALPPWPGDVALAVRPAM